MQVGKQIQHYRKEKNLSQDELAAIIFVSRQSISNWERGATYPDIQNLLLLSKVFEVSLDKLVILYLDGYGIAISCLILAVAIFYALRIEKFKKKHNLRTYRQLVAYDQGRSLSEIEEAEERGKAPYENIILPVLFSLGIVAITLLISWLLLTFFPIK